MVDSRAVVGLGERTLHLAPGAVIMYANGATTEDFRESEVLWWVLLDDYFADFREKKSPEGCMGSGSSTISQQHFWLPEGLNVREPGHHGGLQGVKSVMVGPIEGPFTVSKKNWGCRGARIINRNHHNNFNSLKASMVTGFADMPREETTLLLMNRSPLQPPRLLFF